MKRHRFAVITFTETILYSPTKQLTVDQLFDHEEHKTYSAAYIGASFKRFPTFACGGNCYVQHLRYLEINNLAPVMLTTNREC